MRATSGELASRPGRRGDTGEQREHGLSAAAHVATQRLIAEVQDDLAARRLMLVTEAPVMDLQGITPGDALAIAGLAVNSAVLDR